VHCRERMERWEMVSHRLLDHHFARAEKICMALSGLRTERPGFIDPVFRAFT